MSRTNRPSFSSCSDEPVDTISNDDSITSVINAVFDEVWLASKRATSCKIFEEKISRKFYKKNVLGRRLEQKEPNR